MNVYEIKSMAERISGNPYVGRGIVSGQTKDGKAVFAYFIMGRSVNSRNRIFTKMPYGIKTEAHDPAKLSDPSLIIYNPVKALNENVVIVSNGDQTDTVYDFMKEGKTVYEALATREFEPDGPNWTPRITSVHDMTGGKLSYNMSILKSLDEEGSSCVRNYFNYEGKAGLGHFIHTYVTDGNPIPTFCGEPERVSIPDDIDAFTNEIWNNLNEENKISLYVSYTDLATKQEEVRLINKNC